MDLSEAKMVVRELTDPYNGYGLSSYVIDALEVVLAHTTESEHEWERRVDY